jgi:hypothetical protein
MLGNCHFGNQGMGIPSDGCEECISSQRSLLGDLYGASLGLHAGFIFGMLTEEVPLWPQVGPEGMVCQDGLLPVVTEHCML